MVLSSIRDLRQQKGLSQEYMSLMLDISQNHYSKLERGVTELSVPKLYAIAEVLGVTVHEILPPVKPAYGLNWPAIEDFLVLMKTKVKRLFAGRRKPKLH